MQSHVQNSKFYFYRENLATFASDLSAWGSWSIAIMQMALALVTSYSGWRKDQGAYHFTRKQKIRNVRESGPMYKRGPRGSGDGLGDWRWLYGDGIWIGLWRMGWISIGHGAKLFGGEKKILDQQHRWDKPEHVEGILCDPLGILQKTQEGGFWVKRLKR